MDGTFFKSEIYLKNVLLVSQILKKSIKNIVRIFILGHTVCESNVNNYGSYPMKVVVLALRSVENWIVCGQYCNYPYKQKSFEFNGQNSFPQ